MRKHTQKGQSQPAGYLRRGHKNALLGVVSLVALAAGAGSSAMATQSDNTTNVRVDAQPMELALNSLAQQFDKQVVVFSDDVKHLSVKTVEGNYTDEQALNLLLSGSGLEYKYINDRTIAVGSPQRLAANNTSRGGRQETTPFRVARSAPRVAGDVSASVQDSATGGSAGNNEPDTFDEIVVTGSHIRRSGYESRAPIQVISRDDIAEQGASTILDIVQFLPANTGSFITSETGGLTGTSQFNVRGLGAGSTLTLINGRRAGKSAVADGNGNQFFDINQLPLSMIGRIDVQTDGASATYGSDAVGGVVNIVTRKGFEGLELMGKASTASNNNWSISMASGMKGDRGSVNLYATFYRQTRNHRTDFDWLRERIHGDGDLSGSRLISGTGAPGTYRQAILDENGNYAGSFSPTTRDPDCEAAGGILRSPTDSRCRHDFADQVAVIPEESRIQAFAEAEYDISDSLKFYSEISFSHNRVLRTTGPLLFRNGEANGSMLIPADHPFNFFVDAGAGDGSLAYINPSDWDNNVHQAVPLVCLCRPLGVEFNGDNSEYDAERTYDYFRALGGFQYDINDKWYADVSYVYNKAERTFLGAYSYIADELNQALRNGTHNLFGTRQANPTLVSPKDGVSVAGFNPDDFQNWHHRSKTLTTTEQTVVDAIFSGELFEMDGGPVGFAFGGQYRNDTYLQHNDSLSATGRGGTPDTEPLTIEGDQTVYAAFAETLLPVTGDLEFAVAARYEDYGAGGSTTDPKITARWQASDSVAVRASFGTSFQAPSVRQKSRASSAQFLDDPASRDADGNLVCVSQGLASNTTINVSGSEDLRPQSSKNLNGGVVFGQDGFQFSVDYWRFDYTDLIRPDGEAQAIVDADCADDGIPNDPRIIRSESGQLRTVNLSFINTGSVVTDGLDFQAGYTFPESDLGAFDVKTAISYVNKFSVTMDDGTSFDGAGSRNFTNAFASVPRWRGNARLAWAKENHSATAIVRYISSYRNDQDDNNKVSAWTSLDLRYSYQFQDMFGAEDMSISLGVNNVFDRDPPGLGVGQRPGYDATVHDIRGRMMYAEFKVGF